IKPSRKTWGPGMPVDQDPPPQRCTTSGGEYVIDNAFFGVFFDASAESASAASDLVANGSIPLDVGTPASFNDPGRFSDQPCIAIPYRGVPPAQQVAQATVHDEFHLFLMFQPAGMMNLWVPLKVLYWHWGGTVMPNSSTSVSGKILGSEPHRDPPAPPTWSQK